MSRLYAIGLALCGPLALGLVHAPAAQAAPIPRYGPPGDTDVQWRDDLRSFIVAHQNPADFELRVGGVLPDFVRPTTLYSGGTNGSFSATAERDIERAWLLDAYTAPVTQMLRIPPECFTGDYIEGVTTTPDHQLPVADYVFAPDAPLAWSGYGFLWAWEYSGNPYYQTPQMLNRAATRIALELIMIDQMHKTRGNDDPLNYVLASEDTNPGGWAAHGIPTSDWQTNAAGMDHPPECVAYACTYQQTRNRSQFLAVHLFGVASEYAFIRSGLSAADRQAFDDGLVRLGNRLATWGPPAMQMNLTTPGANALYLIAALTGDPQAMADYEDYTLAMLSPPLYDEAGYFRDDLGWDASYNNYHLDHLGRLVRQELEYGVSAVHGDVTAALEAMYRLKSHLTVVDPDGELGFRYSPNHWNSRTDQGVVYGQGSKTASAFDGIALGIDGAYADLQGADPADYEGFGWALLSTYHQTRKETGEKHVDQLDDGSKETFAQGNDFDWNPLSTAPYVGMQQWHPWDARDHGYVRPAWASMLDSSGLLTAWEGDLAADPELDLFPVQRSQDGIEIIDDDFVWARFGPMTTLIHTGPVSSFEDDPNPNPDISQLPAGYGGGMLSYVHGDQAGAGMIGRRRARYGLGQTPAEEAGLNDNWSEWWRWSLHDVWLRNDQGGLTQSGRILQPSTTVSPSYSGSVPVSVDVAVGGDIPTTNDRFGTVLTDPVAYSRTFEVSASGVLVETVVGPSADPLLDAVETIPLNGIGYRFQGLHMLANQGIWEDDLSVIFTDAYGNDHDILGTVDPAGQQILVEQYIDDVVLVTYSRLGGEVVVEFGAPQRIKLTEPYAHWTTYFDGTGVDSDGSTSQSFLRTRNLVVDLIGNADSGVAAWLMATSVDYTIFTY